LEIPADTELTGSCCHRTLDANQTTAPEMRVSYVQLTEPRGSQLTSSTILNVLNKSVGEERFNWLMRLTPGTGNAISIETGFGRRNGTTSPSSYHFSTTPDPAAWTSVTVNAMIDGDTVTSEPFDGTVTLPVLDPNDDTMATIELALRNVQIVTAELRDNRACIGWNGSNVLPIWAAITLTVCGLT